MSIDVVCRIGDGVGGPEVFLSKNYTVNVCHNAVRQAYPDANGATMTNPCDNGCSCYAEFNMTGWGIYLGWGSKTFQSCMFLKGNH